MTVNDGEWNGVTLPHKSSAIKPKQTQQSRRSPKPKSTIKSEHR